MFVFLSLKRLSNCNCQEFLSFIINENVGSECNTSLQLKVNPSFCWTVCTCLILLQWILLGTHVCLLSHFSCVWLLATPWTITHKAPLSMGFSRQEYWSGLLSLLQGIFPIQALNQQLLGASPALAVRFFTTSTTWEVLFWETDISNNESKAG